MKPLFWDVLQLACQQSCRLKDVIMLLSSFAQLMATILMMIKTGSFVYWQVKQEPLCVWVCVCASSDKMSFSGGTDKPLFCGVTNFSPATVPLFHQYLWQIEQITMKCNQRHKETELSKIEPWVMASMSRSKALQNKDISWTFTWQQPWQINGSSKNDIVLSNLSSSFPSAESKHSAHTALECAHLKGKHSLRRKPNETKAKLPRSDKSVGKHPLQQQK